MVMTRAPLRISFVGGGSDIVDKDDEHCGGAVRAAKRGETVSAAIDKYVYCIAKKRRDSKIYVSWSKKEVCDSVDEVEHGVVREALKLLGFGDGGIEISFIADIPSSGSGLGSSAAVGVALIHALLVLRGHSPGGCDRNWIAAVASKIQVERLGNAQGSQDEFISAIGGILKMEYNWDRLTPNNIVKLQRTSTFDIGRLEDHFLLFEPSGMTGRKAASVLKTYTISKEFREQCVDLSERFWTALCNADFSDLGKMVYEHYKLKCLLSSLVSPEVGIDPLEKAGLGFKLCGAGSTGHILVYAEPEIQSSVVKLAEQTWGRNLPFRFCTEGTTVLWQK
jgi:D-glycero-alpha-D-manno-heptose-7-phosphate kinase